MTREETVAGDEPTRRTSANQRSAAQDSQAGPMHAARQDLLVQIKDLEGTLRYMGKTHPQKERIARRHKQLQLLLDRWEEAQRMQQEVRTMLDRHK